MATTHWGAVSAYPEAGRLREQELKTGFWAEALTHGACYKRVQMPQRDVGDTIEHILAKQFEATATQVQWELVDLDKRVSQTEAGQKLIDTLQKRSGLWVPAAQELSDSESIDSDLRSSARFACTYPILDTCYAFIYTFPPLISHIFYAISLLLHYVYPYIRRS
jgi:hypothetical protein